MKDSGSHLRKAMSERAVLGTWCVLGDPAVIEILGQSQFDFGIIDTEHGPHGYEAMTHMIRAAESSGLTALVRPSGVDESSILRSLDCGAHGLMVPNITSYSQVEELVNFVFYPPVGKRGHSPFARAGGYTSEGAQERMSEINASVFWGY